MVRLLGRVVDVRREELPALGWTWLYFYAVLASYYVLRPIREEAAVAGGVDNLPWLWIGTLVAVAISNPAFGALVARLPRVKFVAVSYRFFALNLIVFFLVLRAADGEANIWAGRVFYVWAAVFNLFVPSVFWAFMTDIFTRDQAKRLFGIISAGGTLGALTGSLLTATLAEHIPPVFLLFFSVALLELSVLAVRRLSQLSERLRAAQSAPTQEQIIGGSVLAGVRNATSSPYLLGISLYMLLFTTLSTVLYFQLAGIVDRSLADRAARTAFFARVDLLTNGLALVLQLFAFGNLVRLLGLTVTLGVLPAVSAAGFALLGAIPAVAVVVVFQAVRRACEFAIARPAREVLFIVLPREDRYKAKHFIDTVVYRLGDQVGAWSQVLLGAAGLGVAGIAWAAVPLSLVWVVNGLWLGRKQETLAARARAEPAPGPVGLKPDRYVLERT
jgi:AAA family ATP:ADP antiporter